MQKMSMTDYLIRLKPLTPYFFGGENTFGEGGVNYYVRSNYLPQQTTLLGFLRYELLAQNNLLGTDPDNPKDNWRNLIGKDSFKETDEGFTKDFGAIKKLSPVFLSNGITHYLPGSMEWTMTEEKHEKGVKEMLAHLMVDYTIQVDSNTGIHRKKIPLLTTSNGKPYNPKYGIKPLWISADGQSRRQWDYEKGFKKEDGFENGFFIGQQQIGIHRKKIRKGSGKDEGDFYKQVSYKLDEDYAFAFYATLDLPEGKKIEPRVVTMGGDRSVFKMEVEKATNTFEKLFSAATYPGKRNQKAIVLVSDAFAKSDILDNCDFAITDSVPFRNIQTKTVKQGDYTRIHGGAIGKTDTLYYLLKRGSIFFADDTESIKASLHNDAFKTIGYNYFIEL
jgi:CRISPR-associated protein Cmr3